MRWLIINTHIESCVHKRAERTNFLTIIITYVFVQCCILGLFPYLFAVYLLVMCLREVIFRDCRIALFIRISRFIKCVVSFIHNFFINALSDLSCVAQCLSHVVVRYSISHFHHSRFIIIIFSAVEFKIFYVVIY